MKYLLYLLLGTIAITACNSQADKPAVVKPGEFTTIQWIDSVKNMGTITAGQNLQISFRFKNVGDKPLVIQSVNPSCGCTVADYPKEPIAPGKEGEITAAFDSKGKEGLQKKSISVLANTQDQPSYSLQFEVMVEKPKP